MAEIIGGLMLAAVFLLVFVILWRIESFFTACGIFAASFCVCGWVAIGAFLMGQG